VHRGQLVMYCTGEDYSLQNILALNQEPVRSIICASSGSLTAPGEDAYMRPNSPQFLYSVRFSLQTTPITGREVEGDCFQTGRAGRCDEASLPLPETPSFDHQIFKIQFPGLRASFRECWQRLQLPRMGEFQFKARYITAFNHVTRHHH
jgi:hypothetical protein